MSLGSQSRSSPRRSENQQGSRTRTKNMRSMQIIFPASRDAGLYNGKRCGQIKIKLHEKERQVLRTNSLLLKLLHTLWLKSTCTYGYSRKPRPILHGPRPPCLQVITVRSPCSWLSPISFTFQRYTFSPVLGPPAPVSDALLKI